MKLHHRVNLPLIGLDRSVFLIHALFIRVGELFGDSETLNPLGADRSRSDRAINHYLAALFSSVHESIRREVGQLCGARGIPPILSL